VTAKDVADALAKVKDAKTLNVFLNSPGGDVFEGMTIYNLIRRFDGEKNGLRGWARRVDCVGHRARG
jgi:ATP-dependent Clp protease protease subunit